MPMPNRSHQTASLLKLNKAWAEAKGTPGETYHVADDSPVPRRDFYTLLAQLLNAPSRRLIADPFRVAAARGDLAIE